MQRPQLVLVAAVAAALLLMLAGLRQRKVRPLPAATDETAEVDENPNRGSPSGHTNVVSYEEMDVRPAKRVTRVRKLSSAEWKEDFDTQKLRAVGDAHITGTVRDDEEEKPVAGAEVLLFEDDPMTTNPALRTTTADSEGSYTLPNLNEAGVRFMIVAKAPGFAPTVERVSMNGPLEHNLTLTKGVPLSGTVLDSKTSAPIAAATVYYPGSRFAVYSILGTVTSGANGQYSFPAVRPGELRVLSEAVGYARTVTAVRAPNREQAIPMRPGGATIRGMTVSRLGEKPVGGARVTAGGIAGMVTTFSKPDGQFEIANLSGGDYAVVAFKGMASNPVRLKLGDTEVKEGVKLVMPSELYVNGRVIRADNRKPVPGVAVQYQGPLGGDTVISDEQGRFAFQTLAVDSYTVRVHERGLVPMNDKSTTSVEERIVRKIDAGQSSDELEILLRPVPALAGNVRKGPSGGPSGDQWREGHQGGRPPVWNADIYAYVQQGDTMTGLFAQSDPSGYWFVNLPDDGRGFARILALRGKAATMASTRVPARRPLRMTLGTSQLRGELYLTDGTPLSGVRINSTYKFGDQKQYDKLQTLRGGGTYTGLYGNITMTMPAEPEVELTFRLPDSQEIRKTFPPGRLTRGTHLFIYDPLAKDIVHDARGGQGGGRRGGGRGGRGSGSGAQPTPAR